MTLFFETIRIVLPVFLVIGLGYLLRRLGLFDDAFTRQTNRLVYLVFLPILLFYKISQADFVTYFNGPLVIGSSLAIACLFSISYAYGYLRKYPPASLGSFCQGSFRGNLAYVGLALCLNAYGESGLTRASILMGFLVPVLNFFAIIALILPQRKSDSGGPKQNWLREILLNPLILASFIGIVWSYFRLPVPIIIKSSLGIVAGLTLPLALLAIGGSFSLQRLKGDLKSASIATFFKLLGMPLVAGLLLIAAGVQGVDLGIGILLAGTPAATATYIMAHQMKADAELAGSIVMLSTLASAVSYTLLLILLRHNGL
ncbi:AEC family transporter [Geopsychrobacter electrodiphilus]|uniref:AEC family transporter n=1 Tax=Geopsychrobacter electrodiphilus TaxID=225196 RepID=UPI0003761473|nr:AEC family transporter [Geopsychrobacter electrodiphilus]